MSPSLLLSQPITNRVWNRCRSTVHDDSSVTLICMLIFDHYEILGNCSPSFLRTQHFSLSEKLELICMLIFDHYEILGNFSPSFPRTQHFSLSEKLVLTWSTCLPILRVTLAWYIISCLHFRWLLSFLWDNYWIVTRVKEMTLLREEPLACSQQSKSPVFHSYSILKKLFSLVFYSIDCIVESPLRFMDSLSLYSSSYKTCKRKWYKHDAKKTVRTFPEFKSLKFKQTGVF